MHVYKKYILRIPMTVIHVYFEISFRGGAKFLAEERGGLPAPTPIAGSATVEYTYFICYLKRFYRLCLAS